MDNNIMRRFTVGLAYGLILFGAGYCMGARPESGLVSEQLAGDAIRLAYKEGQKDIIIASLDGHKVTKHNPYPVIGGAK